MSRRVVVTGLGAVTPIGNNVDDFWTSVKAGKIGFDHITKFDTTDYKCHIAAELKDFNPQDFMDRKAAKRMEPFSQYAVAAAKQAIDDSGLDIEKEDPYMVGCAIGSGIGSLQAMERETQKLYEKGPNRVNPLLVPLMICNMATAPVCAKASIISTPGITGFPGKCPIKCGSFIVTFFLATHFTPGSSSSTVSMRRNGLRCGRISIICCVFIIDIYIYPFSIYSKLSTRFALHNVEPESAQCVQNKKY